MAMLAMAFAFTSCGSDDDDTPGGGGSTTEVRRLYFFDNGSQYLNRQYKLTVGSETKTIKIDDLKKISVAPESVESKAGEGLQKARNEGETINIYSYDIPATMHGVATLKSDFSIKDGVELPEKLNVVISGFIGVGSETRLVAHGNFFRMGGMLKERVLDYINQRNASNLGSCDLK